MCAERMISSIRPTPERPPSYRRPAVPASVGRPRSAGAGHEVYCSVVLLDVANSASRDHRGQLRMRDDLYEIMAEVTDDDGIDIESLQPDDTGDGMRLIIPSEVMRPARVVDTFVTGLAAVLREHHQQSSEKARIRMRACFDSGFVSEHRRGWTGEPLVRAARLIDANQVREALATDPGAHLVTVLSEPAYDVRRSRFTVIPPDCFQRIRVRVKEFDGTAWLLAPGACRHCAFR
jgi:hypothetical protein